MSQVSRRRLNPVIEKRLNTLLDELFATAKTPTEASSLIYQLLTKTEQIMLTKRLAIGLMLLKGFGYATINDTLKVSPTTINKVGEWMKFKGKALNITLERLIKREKIKIFFQGILESFEDVLLSNRPGSYWKEIGKIRRAAHYNRAQNKDALNKL